MEDESRVAVAEPETARTLAEFTPLVRRICRGILRHRQEAEDAEQETLLQMLRALPEFQDRGSLEGWVRRIAVRTSMKTARRRRWISWMFREVPIAPPSESQSDAVRQLYHALGKLSARERVVFILKHQEGQPFSEVALTLGIQEGTAKNYAFRAAQKLKRLLGGLE